MKPSTILDRTAANECRVFARYLSGVAPSEYVMSCYARALPSASAAGSRAPGFDRALLGLARLGGPATRIADAYAARFQPYGPLRRRLILMLAVLENAPPTATPLNSARSGTLIGTGLYLTGTVVGSGGFLLLGILLLGPLHLLSLPFRGGR